MIGETAMSELTPLEQHVIEVAREDFVTKGILKTEMRDLAARVGISRSSLYRHFPSSLSIAFYVLNDVLTELMTVEGKIPESMSGYEQFSLYMYKAVDKLCVNLNMVRFIKEFDTLYDLKSGTGEAPAEYYATLSDYSRYQFIDYYRKGVADGSIKPCENVVHTALTFYWVAQSMVEHIMLREETYLHEHGAAKEFVVNAVELMLAGIKA